MKMTAISLVVYIWIMKVMIYRICKQISLQHFNPTSNLISYIISIMLALSPPLFSTIGWPLEDHPTSHDHNNYFSAESSFLQFPAPLQPHLDQLDHSTPPSTAFSGESTISSMAKKLNHNASERDRRKKINNLYSSLRSLVPADQAVWNYQLWMNFSHICTL